MGVVGIMPPANMANETKTQFDLDQDETAVQELLANLDVEGGERDLADIKSKIQNWSEATRPPPADEETTEILLKAQRALGRKARPIEKDFTVLEDKFLFSKRSLIEAGIKDDNDQVAILNRLLLSIQDTKQRFLAIVSSRGNYLSQRLAELGYDPQKQKAEQIAPQTKPPEQQTQRPTPEAQTPLGSYQEAVAELEQLIARLKVALGQDDFDPRQPFSNDEESAIDALETLIAIEETAYNQLDQIKPSPLSPPEIVALRKKRAELIQRVKDTERNLTSKLFELWKVEVSQRPEIKTLQDLTAKVLVEVNKQTPNFDLAQDLESAMSAARAIADENPGEAANHANHIEQTYLIQAQEVVNSMERAGKEIDDFNAWQESIKKLVDIYNDIRSNLSTFSYEQAVAARATLETVFVNCSELINNPSQNSRIERVRNQYSILITVYDQYTNAVNQRIDQAGAQEWSARPEVVALNAVIDELEAIDPTTITAESPLDPDIRRRFEEARQLAEEAGLLDPSGGWSYSSQAQSHIARINQRVDEIDAQYFSIAEIIEEETSVTARIAKIREMLDRIDSGGVPSLSSTNTDQVLTMYTHIDAEIKKLVNTQLNDQDRSTIEELVNDIFISKARMYCRAFISRISHLEANNMPWTNFDSPGGGIFGPTVFNPLQNLVRDAEYSGNTLVANEIQSMHNEATTMFGLIKGAYGYWRLGGQALLGNKGDESGAVRVFPSLDNIGDELAMSGDGILSFVRDEHMLGDVAINRTIERTERTLTPEIMSRFNLNEDFEDGSDFLDRNVALRDGREVVLENETTVGWCMRMFDKIMRHDWKGRGRFIDPKTGRPIDSFEIHGQNSGDLINYVYRKAQAYGLKLQEHEVMRSLRFWVTVTMNHVALAPHPTGVSDKVYQTFHWMRYLLKEMTYGITNDSIEPFMGLCLYGDNAGKHPFDAYSERAGSNDFLRSFLHHLTMNGAIQSGGLSSWFDRGKSPTISQIQGTDNIKYDRVLSPRNGFSDEDKMLAVFFNFPLIDSTEMTWDIEPPLQYFRAEVDDRAIRFTELIDEDDNYLYELMPWDNVSLMNYYIELMNKAMGFVKNLLQANWKKFIESVDGQLVDLFKNIQYTLAFFPNIGEVVREGHGARYSKDILGPGDQLTQIELTPEEIEDVLRFVVLLQYITIKMIHHQETKWTKDNALRWSRNFFTSHPDYFAKSRMMGDDPIKKNEKAQLIISAFVNALEPFIVSFLKTVNRGVEHAAEGARRSIK